MTFSARYPGRCGACDGRIHVDDQVTYSDDELVHATCNVPPNPRDDSTTVCRACWCIHKGECA